MPLESHFISGFLSDTLRLTLWCRVSHHAEHRETFLLAAHDRLFVFCLGQPWPFAQIHLLFPFPNLSCQILDGFQVHAS